MKLKRMSFNFAYLIVILVLIILIHGVSGELQFDEFPEYSTNDYFIHKTNADGWVDAMGYDIDPNNYIGSENTTYDNLEMRVLDNEEIATGNNTEMCQKITKSTRLLYTLIFEEGSTGIDDDKLKYDAAMTFIYWYSISNNSIVKEETHYTVNLHFSEDGEEHIYLYEEVENKIYTNSSEYGWPFPLTVGSSWSGTGTYQSNVTVKSKEDNGDWEYEYTEETITEKIDIEIISENTVLVPSGSFLCLKIKIQEMGEEGYEYSFRDRNGVQVKRLLYGIDDKLELSQELIEYHKKIIISNEKDDGNNFIPLIEVPILIVIFLSVVLLEFNNKNRNKD